MKFKEGDAVATIAKGTALLAQKGPAVGTITKALPPGHPSNWFGDREPEYTVQFDNLPKKPKGFIVIMKEAEMEHASIVANVEEQR